MIFDVGKTAFRQRLRNGERLLGAWCNLPCPAVAEIAGRAGFDVVVVDFQHSLIDEGLAADMFRAIEAAGAIPAARAGAKDPLRLGKLLDLGAAALIIPMIDSVGEAEEIIRGCLYPPHGARSFGPIRAAGDGGGRKYASNANDEICLLPMIETKGGLADAAAIAALSGVAGLFVGPADLSLSLGLAPSRDHADATFDKALAAILNACARAGVGAGIQAERMLAERRFEQGFSFVTAAMDSEDLARSFRETVTTVTPPRSANRNQA